MATSHIIDSLIAACNDCEVKSVGIMKKNNTFLNSRCWNNNSWKGCIVPEMESFCNESFRLNVVSSEEYVFLF